MATNRARMTRGIDVIDRFWLTFQVRNEIPQQQHRRRLFAFFMSFAYKQKDNVQ